MTEEKAIISLAACRSLAVKLSCQRSICDYQLSSSEVALLDANERILHPTFYKQQFDYLAERAGLSGEEWVCLVNMLSVVCLRRLRGKDAASGYDLALNPMEVPTYYNQM